MAELPEDLLAAVNDQAGARVAMNVQGYARYLTPAAIDSLRATFPGIPPRVSRYEIDASDAQGSEYVVEVRYFSRDDSFVVRSLWRKEGEAWKVLHAERLWQEGDKRPGFLSRLAATVLGPIARRRRR